MLNSLPLSILMGLVFGLLAGLGIGGGTLLVMWLTLVVGMDHTAARAINLMFFVAAAGAVCIFRLIKGTLKIKPLLPAILAGCLAAGLFSRISAGIDTGILQKCFGVLLLLTGIRELLYRDKKAR